MATSITLSPIIEDGAVTGASAIVRDITRRVEAERLLREANEELEQRVVERTAALRASEERYRRLTENAPDIVFRYRLRPEPGYDYVNPRVTELLGYAPEEFYADPEFGLAILHPDDREDVTSVVETFPEARIGRWMRRDGSPVWMEQRAVALHDADGDVVAYEGIARDITDLATAKAELSHRALHDPLTNLPNRTLLFDRLEHAVGKMERSGPPVAVLFLDLDRFKVVNDSLGHVTGDALIVAVAERLRLIARPADTIARLGGDEFVVLVEEAESIGDVVTVAQRIVRSLAEPFTVGDHEIFTSTSIGIALPTASEDRAEDLLKYADTAMYRAKARGPGNIEIFDEMLRTRVAQRLSTETALRRAVERRELKLLYQPVVSLATGRVWAAEALVRWMRPGRGMVAADEFIAIAEETGLIVPIGLWVLEEACAQAVRWRDAGNDLRMHVNLSAAQLRPASCVEDMLDIVARSGVDPSAICLEITETALMADPDTSLLRLQQLRAGGVTFAIDDFGTGYSSLSYLKRFPVSVLKVDKSFVHGLGSDANDTAIVETTIRLGQTLGLELVAEGIEQPEQVDMLRALGCESGQGFLFARPQEADALIAQRLMPHIAG
jgi:diguanylate cyclase (GGDEF)-like protein/PAS domain S-box-containing protein